MRQFRVITSDHDILLRPGAFIIGRSRVADLILRSPGVSRKHAMLRITRDSVSVEDIGSRNGVRVNGRRIDQTTVLRDGDRIEVGEDRVYLVEGARASARFTRPSGAPTHEFFPPETLGPDERTVRTEPMGAESLPGSIRPERLSEQPGELDPTC